MEANGNGLRTHFLGAGFEERGRPCALPLHGFPELAYSWRRVMLALAQAASTSSRPTSLECYHCRTAHPTFSETLDVSQTDITVEGIVSRQSMPVSDDPGETPYVYAR